MLGGGLRFQKKKKNNNSQNLEGLGHHLSSLPCGTPRPSLVVAGEGSSVQMGSNATKVPKVIS